MPQSTTFATSPVLGTQEAPTDGSFLGRHEALQQLLKILPYCQSGQGKTVLLTGAEGLGKTTLIEQFMIQAHGSLGLSSIYVPVSAPTTLTQFVQSMVQALEQTAASVAEGLLVQIQADLDSIGIRWDQEQILSLLKPFFEDPHTITRPDTFAEALKSYLHNAVSFFKRLHPNVEGVIGGLVQTLTHPWLLIYAGMYYGQLQSYSQLKEALAQLPLEQLSVFVTQTTSADTLVSESPLPEEGGGLESEIHSAEPALKSWTAEVSSIRPVGQSASNAETTAEGSASSLNGTVLLAQSMAQLILALSHILSLYKHAFVLCFDQWDSLQDCVYEQQSAIKQFVSELIRHTAEKRNFFGFILLACRSEHESYLLGSALYNRFRQKMLLGPLSEKDMSALLSSSLLPLGLRLEEAVKTDVLQYFRGNPAWIKVFRALAQLYSQQHKTLQAIDFRTYREYFAVNRCSEWLELLLNQLHVLCAATPDLLDPLLSQLVTHYGRQPFTLAQATALLPPTFTDNGVVDTRPLQGLLAHLSNMGFLKVLPTTSLEGHPVYQFTSGFYLSALQERLRPVQTDIPLQDKVASLRRIIPLAIESGEITEEKVQNILSVAHTLHESSLVTYLESSLVQALHTTANPVLKPAYMSGLAAMATPGALSALQMALADVDVSIKTSACHYLLLCLSRMHPQPHDLTQVILDVIGLTQPVSSTTPYDPLHLDCQRQAIEFLIHFPAYGHLTQSVFEHGLYAQDPTLQLMSIKGLTVLRVPSIELLHVIQTLLQAPATEAALAKAALAGLAHYEAHLMMPVLINFLDTQPDHPAWHEGLKLLLEIEPAQALPWIQQTLEHPNVEADLKLYLLRHLGSNRSKEGEQLLIAFLKEAAGHMMVPEIRWMAIRSLGWVGSCPKAYEVLAQQHVWCYSDPILSQTLQLALQQLAKRLDLPEPLTQTIAVEAVASPSHSLPPLSLEWTDLETGERGTFSSSTNPDELLEPELHAPPPSRDWETIDLPTFQ